MLYRAMVRHTEGHEGGSEHVEKFQHIVLFPTLIIMNENCPASLYSHRTIRSRWASHSSLDGGRAFSVIQCATLHLGGDRFSDNIILKNNRTITRIQMKGPGHGNNIKWHGSVEFGWQEDEGGVRVKTKLFWQLIPHIFGNLENKCWNFRSGWMESSGALHVNGMQQTFADIKGGVKQIHTHTI